MFDDKDWLLDFYAADVHGNFMTHADRPMNI
jgi:hypothetical protein